MKSLKPILLVEDDSIDAMTVKRALNEIKVGNDIIHVKNGEEALEYLLSEDCIIPCLILLDINMPKMNGIEFLRERNKIRKLRLIPTVILTTSNDDQDKYDSFDLNIAGYMVKPVDYARFVELIKTIDLYWSLSETVDYDS
ncbi:MAG: response regulator [Cyclobacteriaceae bacterium]|nr:response regulator [Cyclobacteriaceae bacterium]